jgi:hypothetical protein
MSSGVFCRVAKILFNPVAENSAVVTSIPKSHWKEEIPFVFKKPFM